MLNILKIAIYFIIKTYLNTAIVSVYVQASQEVINKHPFIENLKEKLDSDLKRYYQDLEGVNHSNLYKTYGNFIFEYAISTTVIHFFPFKNLYEPVKDSIEDIIYQQTIKLNNTGFDTADEISDDLLGAFGDLQYDIINNFFVQRSMAFSYIRQCKFKKFFFSGSEPEYFFLTFVYRYIKNYKIDTINFKARFLDTIHGIITNVFSSTQYENAANNSISFFEKCFNQENYVERLRILIKEMEDAN